MSDTNLSFAAFDQWVNNWLQKTGMPGLAVCILDRNGEEVFSKACGTHDKATGQALANDAIFPIASQSKTFTALAILQLIHDKATNPQTGRVLSLKDKITDLLPHLTTGVDAKDNWLADVTLEDALAHRTKFGGADEMTPTGAPTSDDLRKVSIAGIEPAEVNVYSNRMYNQLGLIAEDFSGMSFNQYISDKIIKDHNLGEIYPSLKGVPRKELERIPFGYSGENLELPIRNEDAGALTPSGGFYATKEALANAYRRLASGDILSEHKAGADMATGMFKPERKRKYCAGLGTQINSMRDKHDLQGKENHYYVPHATGNVFGMTGGMDGFQSGTHFNPQTGYTVCVVRTGYDVDDRPDRKETPAQAQARIDRVNATQDTGLVVAQAFNAVVSAEHARIPNPARPAVAPAASPRRAARRKHL